MAKPKFFSSKFIRTVIWTSPLSLLILYVPSGDVRSWYDKGFGWPLFYGWLPTDVRPRYFPAVESWLALGVDVLHPPSSAVVRHVRRWGVVSWHPCWHPAARPLQGVAHGGQDYGQAQIHCSNVFCFPQFRRP